MSEFLLKIEDVFEIAGRGSILLPNVPREIDLPKKAKVTLINPDKSVLEAEAEFVIPFLHFSSVEDNLKHQPAAACILKNLPKRAIQIGTEVWLK